MTGEQMTFVEFLEKHRGIQPARSDKYGEWLGYMIDSFDSDSGFVQTSLKLRQDHLSPSGAVHGGVVSGFLDFTCGCAVFAMIDKTQLCSTVDLNVKYFRPLKEGNIIIAEAQVLHKGRSLSSVEAKLYLEKDREKIMAMATGTFNIYPMPQR